MNIRPIAFVLPQFHPIPENDLWWGKDFTEWTNVKKAKPLYKKHYQPQIPSDLGYYDLRDPEARSAQASLAQKYGIFGFCYYHYWFNGKRLLNYPVDEILRLKEPKMPFMLCWANENWTRTWDGKDNEVLIKQEYNFTDDATHMRWLCKNVFSDDRYISVNDCPVFVIYRHDLFPDINKTAALWQEIAIKEFGYKGLYLCITESFNNQINPEAINFDASIEFSPHQVVSNKLNKSLFANLLIKLGLKNEPTYSLRDFQLGVKQAIDRKLPDYKLYRSVTPSWDNTPRKNEKGVIAIGSSPKLYYKWLKHIVRNFKTYSKEENFVFINAMNEWAEGNQLEPSEQHGVAYLEATKKAINTEID